MTGRTRTVEIISLNLDSSGLILSLQWGDGMHEEISVPLEHDLARWVESAAHQSVIHWLTDITQNSAVVMMDMKADPNGDQD